MTFSIHVTVRIWGGGSTMYQCVHICNQRMLTKKGEYQAKKKQTNKTPNTTKPNQSKAKHKLTLKMQNVLKEVEITGPYLVTRGSESSGPGA